MDIVIKHEILSQEQTTNHGPRHRFVAVAEGEPYLVDEFYIYLSKFKAHAQKNIKEV